MITFSIQLNFEGHLFSTYLLIDLDGGNGPLWFAANQRRGLREIWHCDWLSPEVEHLRRGRLVDINLAARFQPIFCSPGLDGMRCDVEGNIYQTRWSNGVVLKLAPNGEILKTIELAGKRPTNLAFGGDDGKDRIISFTCLTVNLSNIRFLNK